MANAILLHGMPDKEEYYSDKYPSMSNSHWFPWLQKQLLIKDIHTETPEVVDAHKPVYKVWEKEFEQFNVNENTILVGHSCGAGFLLRWLSENKTNIKKLILVAPWLDPERTNTDTFFDFTVDSSIHTRTQEIHLFISKDDESDILTSFETIRGALPNATVHEFEDKGHFTLEEMKTEKFPELLETILS